MSKSLASLVLVLVLVASVRAQAQPDGREMLATARAFAELDWTMSADNARGCPAPWRPDFGPGPVRGMAYKWGGFDDIARFQARLAARAGAGSHQRDGVLSCATGIDCSGFISRVWGLPDKYGTATLHEVSRPVRISDLQPGDALNKPGEHVVLYEGRGEDGAPIIYEAAASAGKVRRRRASWGQLDGYRAIRLEPSSPTCAGSATEPFVIRELPFSDRRDTTAACSDHFDAYACRPAVDEGGPEVVYLLELPQATRLRARVEDGVGVDVDVHVLTAEAAPQCIAAADLELTADLEAGRYLVVVDTWVDRGGRERAGAYHVSLEAFED